MITNDKFKELSAQLGLHSGEIRTLAKADDFVELRLKVLAMKQEQEEENEMIQRSVRECKDKSAELIKKFDLVVEQIQVKGDASNVSKILGRGPLERGESQLMPKAKA